MIHTLAARIIVGALAALGTLRFGTGLYFWRVTEALERPSYTVISELSGAGGGKVEIRRYEPYLIAETIVDGVGFREPTSQGFRACAGYIFGKNKPAKSGSWLFSSSSSEGDSAAETMQMTAPVRVSGEAPPSVKACDSGGDTITMKKTKVSFVIGKNYTLRTAPKPLDSNVKVRQVPAHTLAVKTFSGPPPNDKRVLKERVKLEKALAKAGLDVPSQDAETLVYGYHDPFITPSFLRRNEVALVIDGSV